MCIIVKYILVENSKFIDQIFRNYIEITRFFAFPFILVFLNTKITFLKYLSHLLPKMDTCVGNAWSSVLVDKVLFTEKKNIIVNPSDPLLHSEYQQIFKYVDTSNCYKNIIMLYLHIMGVYYFILLFLHLLWYTNCTF